MFPFFLSSFHESIFFSYNKTFRQSIRFQDILQFPFQGFGRPPCRVSPTGSILVISLLNVQCISQQNYLKLHGSVFYLLSVYLPNLKQILLRNERNIWVFILREDLRYVYISFKYKLFIALREQKCSS